MRTFRLDRMSAVAVSESVAQHRPSDIELADGLFSEAQDLTVVTLEVVPAAVPLIADYLSSDLPLEDHGEVRRARIRFAHLGHVARLVAGHPGMLRVIDPEEARRAVADWAARGLERYE